MRLHALMSFYDEPVELLLAALGSLELAGVEHVVCLDGAYGLYPDGKAASPANQHAAIVMACRELGIALTLHVPSEPWAGNEAEKRTALFALGWALADEGDWFLVHDADTAITRWHCDVRGHLAATDRQVAEVHVIDTVARRIRRADYPPDFQYCGLFRAQPITVGPHHAVYTGADGQQLWVGNGEASPVPALDLYSMVEIEHRADHRPPERLLAKDAYYTTRNEACVERGDCSRCDEPSVRLVPTRWRMTTLGRVAEWAEACESCAQRLEGVSRRQLRQLGADPDKITVENHNGRAPAGMTV